jgi:hypothetical protein
MTPSDMLAIAERNMRTLDIAVDNLLHDDAKTELRAVELQLKHILRKVSDANHPDSRAACGH